MRSGDASSRSDDPRWIGRSVGPERDILPGPAALIRCLLHSALPRAQSAYREFSVIDDLQTPVATNLRHRSDFGATPAPTPQPRARPPSCLLAQRAASATTGLGSCVSR